VRIFTGGFATVVALTITLAIGPVAPTAASSSAATTPPFRFGAYAGPGTKDIQGVAQFDADLGTQTTQVLDFTPLSDWSQIEGQAWYLQPHGATSQRLELSVPIVPSVSGTSLAACANGDYDSHWAALGGNLVRFGLANAIIRPGWEFNAGWFAWSAAKDPAGFAACFRHVVQAMRSVPAGAFAFDWNVAVGPQAIDGAKAWPGAAYVDYVGVDVYDASWTHYLPGTPPTAAQQAATVNDLLNGPYGLAYWAAFAKQHQRPLAVPEWGVTWRSDGHGGGDDPTFVDSMFAFFADPANNVAYEQYFNTGSASLDHVLNGATRFPNSAKAFRNDAIRYGGATGAISRQFTTR